MWSWLNCHVVGRHEFRVSCEPGAVFLQCLHCGQRSAGWSLKAAESRQEAARLLHMPKQIRLAAGAPHRSDRRQTAALRARVS